jgi:flavin-dependent dehydrogenase
LKIAVVGAGPAGATIARLLHDSGFKVVLFEAQKSFAVKPCGWAFPVLDRDEMNEPIFKHVYDALLWEYKGYKMYLDNDLVYHSSNRLLGYILDKPKFIESLVGDTPIHMGSRAQYLGNGIVSIAGKNERFDQVIIAGGFPSQPKNLEKILALQYWVKTSRVEEPDIPELYFYSEMIGYAWVFPEGEKTLRVGIGGYADRDTLLKLLHNLMKSRKDIASGDIVKFEGAYVTVSGIDWELASSTDPYYVGESMGAVMPATGEGIRLGMWTAIALFRSILNGSRYIDELKKIKVIKFMKPHRLMVEKLLKMTPEMRRHFLLKTPEESLLRISLGRATISDFLKIASRPEVLKAIISDLL